MIIIDYIIIYIYVHIPIYIHVCVCTQIIKIYLHSQSIPLLLIHRLMIFEQLSSMKLLLILSVLIGFCC